MTSLDWEHYPGGMHTGLACAACNFDSDSVRLPHSRKWCFMGHRRFLNGTHRFRLQRNRFNGQQEKRGPPRILSGVEIIEQLVDVDFEYGKKDDPAKARTKTVRASGSAT